MQKDRLPRLEPTAVFTAAPSHGRAPRSGPDLTDGGARGAPIPHLHCHGFSPGHSLTWLSEHPWYPTLQPHFPQGG